MQKEACDAVLKGHNILILGEGGTGKFSFGYYKERADKIRKISLNHWFYMRCFPEC